MSAALTVALPVLPMRSVLVLFQDRGPGAADRIVELAPDVARQLATDLVQATDLAEARKLRGRTTRLAVVSDLEARREGA